MQQNVEEIELQKKKTIDIEITQLCGVNFSKIDAARHRRRANARSGYQERSSRQSNEEKKHDRIIDLDEWPKFDQRGDQRGHVGRRGRTGSSLGKIFKNTRGLRRSRRSPPPFLLLFFLVSLFIYLLPFFGALGFFFLPLGRPSAATEGAAKMQDPRGRG